MDIITSFDNSKVKKIAALAEKKHRDEMSLYVVEGARWITAAAADNNGLIELVAVCESSFDAHKNSISNLAGKTIIISDRVFDKLSLVKNSQGILAVLKMKPQRPVLSAPYSLFLDKIRDPGNMGTIIRSACAAGFNEIICNDCVDVYNPKVIRSSMSAILNVDIFQRGYDALDALKAQGISVIAADMDGVNIFLLETRPEKLCLIIGNEADGISDEALSRTDMKVSIPMNGIESLNAAVSASVLMYLLGNYKK